MDLIRDVVLGNEDLTRDGREEEVGDSLGGRTYITNSS